MDPQATRSAPAPPPFAGDQKTGRSILGRAEKRLVRAYVSRIPSRLETYHLTLMTLGWSLGVLLFGYLSARWIGWIWGISLMLALQYLTDLFDGAVGRQRGTGLVKWGFYMDHLLDFIFSGCLVIAYALMAPAGLTVYFFGLLLCSGGFMVNSFLSFACTNRFEIYHYGLGPTEIRLGYILVNGIIFIWGAEIFRFWLPLVLAVNLLVLAILAFKTQKQLWRMDMDHKASTGPRDP
jgi:phosphatidylglycerophosphate synthase